MSKTEQVKVGNFIEQYLQIRNEIALIIFLIDIRHDPTENDKLMYDYIINKSGNHPCLIIANKADNAMHFLVIFFIELPSLNWLRIDILQLYHTGKQSSTTKMDTQIDNCKQKGNGI